jgi:hypothetical protein
MTSWTGAYGVGREVVSVLEVFDHGHHDLHAQ